MSMNELQKQTNANIQAKANLIWEIATHLVGLFKPHEYGKVILPMTVLKRFDDALKPTKTAVVEMAKRLDEQHIEGAARDGILCRISGYDFYNTSNYDFSKLISDPDGVELNFEAYLQGFSSNIKDIAGLPVVALGRPMGTNGSLGYGIITSSASESAASDTTYRILQTNIVGSQNAGGVLFNLQGQVIGIITNGKSATDMKNMVCAYGITELKRHIEKMSNGEKFAYLGLKGVDVTEEANSELGVPYGAYIKEVEMDSPAMLAGIQQGDVITGFGERMIISFDEYTNSLLSMKPGDSVELTIMRQSQQEYKEMKFDITLTVLK